MTAVAWIPAYIGIGSNLDDPSRQVARGIDALRGLPESRVIAVSRLYRSAPLGPADQPAYVNAAAGMLTQLDPRALLRELKERERQLGRAQPTERWGPRLIDFDILVYGTLRIESDDLRIPHAGVSERAFVLVPLMDIAPTLEVPGLGRVEMLVHKVDVSGVVPL